MKFVIALVLWSQAAWADAPKKPEMSAADKKQYKILLGKGHKLQGQKKYADAISAFEEALKVSPDDAAVGVALRFQTSCAWACGPPLNHENPL